jgi:hypothetical protein
MGKVSYHENFHELDGKVRIEAGLPFIETIATPDVLHDSVTHPDYKAGQIQAKSIGGELMFKDDGSPIMVDATDAKGRVIEHGKPFAYIDFYAPQKHAKGERKHPHNWKVYRLADVPDEHPHCHKEYKWVGGKPPVEVLKSMGVPDEVSKNPALQQIVPPSGTLVEDVDHPMHHKRWLFVSEHDTPDAAEAVAADVLKSWGSRPDDAKEAVPSLHEMGVIK